MWAYVCTALGYTPRYGVARSYSNSNFLRNCQTVLQRSYTLSHSIQQGLKVLVSPHLHQRWLSSFFLILTILVGMQWSLMVVLVCVSLVASDGEQFFMCLLSIGIFSLEKWLF